MRGRAGLFLLLMASAAVVAQGSEPRWVDEARSSADQLARQLKHTLVTAVGEGGPAHAIDACRIDAPEIAASVSSPRLHVGRTAPRVRNQHNAPDDWEALTLEHFQQRLSAGEPAGQIEAFVIRNDGQRRYGHWMKAIPMQGLCTACHGTDLPPEVAEAVDAAYPEDQARGFAVGELRGAFSVEIELDEP